MPEISVIIPTYNHSRFIKEAIDSVLGQSYNDFELIVVDDGSTDDTKAIAISYGDKIKYFYQGNKGRGAARNKGVSLASGEYIAFLDSDDIWFPEKLEKQMAYIKNNDFEGLLHSKVVIVDENKKQLAKDTKNVELAYNQIYKDGYTYVNLLKSCCLFLSCAVFPRPLFKKTGLFNERYVLLEDFDFILRLVKIAPIKLLDEKLVYYRKHGFNSFITDKKGVAQAYLEIFKNQLGMIDEIKDQGQKDLAEKYILRHLVNFSFELNNLRLAGEYIIRLLKSHPSELFNSQMVKNLVKLKFLK